MKYVIMALMLVSMTAFAGDKSETIARMQGVNDSRVILRLIEYNGRSYVGMFVIEKYSIRKAYVRMNKPELEDLKEAVDNSLKALNAAK